VTRRALLGALPAVLAVQESVFAQKSVGAQESVFKVDVNLVRLLVTVKDASGQLVGSLKRDDFRIEDTGTPQEIAVFERHTEQPLSIALVIDTSASTARELKYEITSASRFLRSLTKEGNPDDALALYSFTHDVSLQTSFTRNPARIETALGRLRAEAGTSLYDAIHFAAEGLEDRGGRRVIVMISDGGDTTSALSFQDAERAAHRADAILYAIVVVPIPNDAGRNTGGEHALITLSRSTGGRVFYPTVGKMLDATFDEILRDLRTQYLIGYYPKNLPPSKNGFRPLRVQLSDPTLRASTRGGYYEK
jgi:Ca-activated chloride channel family protein